MKYRLRDTFKLATLALVFGLLSSHAAVAQSNDSSDDMRSANEMYVARNYPRAAAFFRNEIRYHPNNADARCGLGSCLFMMNQKQQALVEYRYAFALAPDSDAGKYSKAMIGSFENRSGKRTVPTVPSAAELAVARSHKTLSASLSERQRLLDQECAGKIQQIDADATNEISQLKKELQQKLESTGVVTESGGVIKGSKASIELYQQYDKQIEDVRLRAKQQSELVTRAYERRKNSTAESKEMMENVNKKQTANETVILHAPTSLFTRSYQTRAAPSGNPTPLIAEPAKLIPTVKLPVPGKRKSTKSRK